MWLLWRHRPLSNVLWVQIVNAIPRRPQLAALIMFEQAEIGLSCPLASDFLHAGANDLVCSRCTRSRTVSKRWRAMKSPRAVNRVLHRIICASVMIKVRICVPITIANLQEEV
jgi:hypothetical protein